MNLPWDVKRLALGVVLASFVASAHALTLHAASSDISNGTDLTRPIALDLTIDTIADEVAMTISGPSDRWFGVAFGIAPFGMVDGPYAIITSDAGVFEQDLGPFNIGVAAPVSITLLSDITFGATRTVSLIRPINAIYAPGGGNNPYDFPTADGAIVDLLWARSSVDTTFTYHGSSGPNAGHAALTLAPVPIPGAVFLLGPAVVGLMLRAHRKMT